MRKNLFVLIMVLMLGFITKSSFAAGFNETDLRLICALSSMASYEDDNAIVVRDMISTYGWKIEPISKESSKADVSALLISKRLEDGTLIKILSICGTSDLKDAEIDFRLKPVPINFNSPHSADILVHQGFQDYSEVMLDEKFTMDLINEIANNPTEKLYLTGHSLGGAVAIITAAKFIDLGIAYNQMEVITFGAPAVGNQAFVDEYKGKINLKRVSMSGDPIKKSLAALGYVHFGEVVKYNPTKAMIEHFPHSMTLYLDCAIRDYYDEQFSSNTQGHKFSSLNNDSSSIYVAPMQVMKKSFTEEDFKYIKAAMKEQLDRQFPAAVYDEVEYHEVEEVNHLADFDNSIEDVLIKANAQGCEYILVYYLQAKKMRNDRDGNYRVSLEEIRYNLQGFPISMQTATMTTTELTMLEAALFAQENLLTK